MSCFSVLYFCAFYNSIVMPVRTIITVVHPYIFKNNDFFLKIIFSLLKIKHCIKLCITIQKQRINFELLNAPIFSKG